MTIIKLPKRFGSDKANHEEAEPKKPKKKKPDPPKPWGRSERLLVTSLLVSTALISSLLALSARAWKLPGLPPFSLPNLSFEKTYIIESPNPTPPASDQIISEFQSLTQALSGRYSFYAVRLSSNQSYGVNYEENFQAASLIKLPIMFALMDFDLTTTHTLAEADKVAGAGRLYGQSAGTVVTYEELITLMGRQSDNTAFHIAVKILGEEKINQTLTQLGMNNTSFKENTTTPRDIGQFFAQLYSSGDANLVLDSLTKTNFEDYLPAGLPSETRVAHKYGREVHVLNDAGIIFTPEPYVLVLMSEGIVDAEAENIFPKLSELIYRFETSQ